MARSRELARELLFARGVPRGVRDVEARIAVGRGAVDGGHAAIATDMRVTTRRVAVRQALTVVAAIEAIAGGAGESIGAARRRIHNVALTAACLREVGHDAVGVGGVRIASGDDKEDDGYRDGATLHDDGLADLVHVVG